ncbi:MAG: DUF5343 domain-containing protein [Alphaproteobacteria bacterium]|nr:DUF5343 domain-containing protein [Alphaproteobacteria bacterium]
MPENTKKTSPPYATFPSFLNFINKLRENGMPNRIDPSVFGNASGSLVYSVLSSLKSLSLIDEDGVPANCFIALVDAADEDRPQLLRQIVIDGYPSLFDGDLDLSNMTAGQFDDHIRSEFDVAGSTIDKIAAFFLAAAKYAGIPVSKHLEKRTPISSSSNSRKSTRQRKRVDNGDNEAPATPPPSTPPSHVISEKALEYRLVDLMTEAANEPEVMQAIITVITFLKTKSASEPTKSAENAGGKEGR